MKKQHLYLAISLFLSIKAFALSHPEGSKPDSINDGPYIFNVHNNLEVEWIENSLLQTKHINPENFPAIKKKFNLLIDYKDLTNVFLSKPNYDQGYNGIDSISIISDIHGEYNTYIKLLKSQGIIDSGLNWKFGKGHLVVIGDSFDRGKMVTEVLWHLFGLEKQAAKAGGMVHVLLGNHEMMVLGNDLRYINEKYAEVDSISDTKYSDLYSENSVLGKWLRLQPVVITINNIMFVHGGISIEMVRRNLKIEQINRIFSKMIIGKEILSDDEIEDLVFLNEDYGPFWYRGYFTETNFCESKIDSILNFYNKEHIVVGHTTLDGIISLYNKKVFGIDTRIMNEQPGSMLIYKNGLFYAGYLRGKRVKL